LRLKHFKLVGEESLVVQLFCFSQQNLRFLLLRLVMAMAANCILAKPDLASA
jgi:hypothetical protein